MNSPRRGFTIQKRFFVAIFALVSLAVIVGGLAYYRYEHDHIRREKYQELSAIADLKVRQILEWRWERLGDAGTMARSPLLRQAIADWLQDPGKPGLRLALLEQFKIVQVNYLYENILLVDPDGRTLLSVRPDPAPLSPTEKQALEAAVAGRQAVLSDLFRCPKDNQVHLDAVAPVLNSQGQALAVAVLIANADQILYPLIQSWTIPSLTAETLLVEVEGNYVLYLNELRHREKTALSLREPLTRTELPAVQAALGQTGMFEGLDYRDQKVLADLRPVPQSPWFMVTKVDADEILAEVRYRSGVTTFFVVICILLTAAVTAFGYRQRQVGILKDLYQTEREQRQAQEEFRTTLYSIGDAVITTNMAGLVKQVNPVAERLTHWLEAEAQGRAIEEVFHILNEETRALAENPVQRVLREGKVVGLANDTLLIARDGTESPIADCGAPIQDENGAVIGVVLVFRDQTRERAAQKALRESEERFRIAAETSNDLIYEWDLKQNLQWPDRIDEMLGYGPGEFPRTLDSWVESVHPEDIDHVKASIKAHLEERAPYVEEYRIRRKDGVYRWWSARGDTSMSPDGTPVRWIGTVTDITERKLAEKALRESEAQYRLLAENVIDVIWTMDLNWKFTYASPSCESLCGYKDKRLLP